MTMPQAQVKTLLFGNPMENRLQAADSCSMAGLKAVFGKTKETGASPTKRGQAVSWPVASSLWLALLCTLGPLGHEVGFGQPWWPLRRPSYHVEKPLAAHGLEVQQSVVRHDKSSGLATNRMPVAIHPMILTSFCPPIRSDDRWESYIEVTSGCLAQLPEQ